MDSYVVRSQPVVVNYRFRTAFAAASVARGDVVLRECRQCGLIFNSQFDPRRVPYDQQYENRQGFSPRFVRYLDGVSVELIRRYRLQGTSVLEIGCGKGDFLRRFCELANARGIGYDTSFEAGDSPADERTTFVAEYLTPEKVSKKFAAVFCRHVIEHVSDIQAFLNFLNEIAGAAGEPVVVVETPAWDWILRETAFWDVSYEHCNYFPRSTLAALIRQSGFRILRHRRVFGGQYQIVECIRTDPAQHRALVAKGARLGTLASFAGKASRSLHALSARIDSLRDGKPWGLWGAGAKGVALVNQLGGTRPTLAVDANPAKQGGFIPGTEIPILAPGSPQVNGLGLMLVVNPQYSSEIRRTLAATGFRGCTETL